MVLDIVGVVVTFLAVFAAAWFIGPYLHRVFTGKRVFLSPVVRPVERLFYRLSGIREEQEQSWVVYLVAMLLVQVVSLLFSYVIFRLQNHLPLNPVGLPAVPADLAFNTAARSGRRPCCAGTCSSTASAASSRHSWASS